MAAECDYVFSLGTAIELRWEELSQSYRQAVIPQKDGKSIKEERGS